MLQMLFYGFVDYIKIENGRLKIVAIFLSLYFFILPNFNSTPKEDGFSVFCYYNPFGYFETYWIIGITLILITHLIYYLLLNKNN